MTHPL